MTVTNLNVTLLDAWQHELHYAAYPPYETYRLWSVGPDGIDHSDDDIVWTP